MKGNRKVEQRLDGDWNVESRKGIVLWVSFLMVGGNRASLSDGGITVA